MIVIVYHKYKINITLRIYKTKVFIFIQKKKNYLDTDIRLYKKSIFRTGSNFWQINKILPPKTMKIIHKPVEFFGTISLLHLFQWKVGDKQTAATKRHFSVGKLTFINGYTTRYTTRPFKKYWFVCGDFWNE